MSLLALKPSLTTFASLLSSSADGLQVLSTRRGLVYLTGPSGGRALMLASGVAAAVVVQGAAWLVTEGPEGHTLHRFGFDGRPQGPARHLGELGDGVTMVATRVAAPMAIVEGRRGVLVRAQGDDVEIEELVVASAVPAPVAEDPLDVPDDAIDDQIEMKAAELFVALAAELTSSSGSAAGSEPALRSADLIAAAEQPSCCDGVPRLMQAAVGGSFE